MTEYAKYILVLSLLALSFYAGMIYSDVQNALSGFDIPEEETNVTCYSWTENGSHTVYCPEKVYAPDSVVNITVEESKPMAN